MEITNKIITFNKYLSLVPPDIIFKHLSLYFKQDRKIISSSTIGDISKKFNSEESLCYRFDSLSSKNKFLCSLTYLFGKKGLPAKKINGYDDELISSFLVFAGKNEKEEIRYYPFIEFESKLLEKVAQNIINVTATKFPLQSDKNISNSFLNCIYDIILISYFACRGLIKKTKKNEFSKTTSSVFKKYLYAARLVNCEDIFLEYFNLSISLLINYSLTKGLIFKKGDSDFCLNPNKMFSWIELPIKQIYLDFTDFAFKTTILWEPEIIKKISKLQKQTNFWLSTSNFNDFIKKEAEIILLLLNYLGYCNIKIYNKEFLFSVIESHDFSNSTKDFQQEKIIIMPDFNVLIPPNVLPKDLFWFLRIGEINSYDKIYKAVITRDMINTSLIEGTKESKIIEWLTSVSAPQNVIETVKEWIREFFRTQISTGTFVMSFNENVTNQLLEYEPFRCLTDYYKPHAVFKILNGHENEAKRILKSMGFESRERYSFKNEKKIIEDIRLEEDKNIIPVVNFENQIDYEFKILKKGKYGHQLKEMDQIDLIHVIDYAILMNKAICINYLGSSFIKKGEYTVYPLKLYKTKEAYLEAFMKDSKVKRKFYLSKIKEIGVSSNE
jgi:hypothetical protein